MIGLISINYKHAPIEIREQFDFSAEQKIEFFKILKTDYNVGGLMILSTCNRTEIYFDYENHNGYESKLMHGVLKALVEYKSFKESLSPYIEKKVNKDVVEHMFRVVAGLESMIVGEYQIVEQLKDAYAFAEQENMLGSIISRMVQKSFETGKYIRTHTLIDKGAVSVSYAAVEKVASEFDVNRISALCVGAGETGTLSVQHLHKKGCKDISITNRTFEKAQQLATSFGMQAIPYEQLKNALQKTDIAMFSTAAKEALISTEEMQQIMQARKGETLLLIDLCVPRNLPRVIASIPGVILIDIDGLKDVVNANYNKRKKEIRRAEHIIVQFLMEFDEWATSRQLRPSILKMKEQFNALIDTHVEKCNCCGKPLNQCAQFLIYQQRISRKFTGHIIKQIKRVSNNGKDEASLKIINQIFEGTNE